MPRQVGKNNKVTRIEFSDFVGGINTQLPAYRLEQNQCVDALNFELTDIGKKFKTRRGMSEPLYTFKSQIKKLWYDWHTNTTYIFVENEKDATKPLDMYSYTPKKGSETAKVTYIGTLLGNDPDILPECVNYGGNIIVSSGSYLQCLLLNPPEWLLSYKNQFIDLNNQPDLSSIRRYTITINQSPHQTIHVYTVKVNGQKVDHTATFIADFGDVLDVEVIPDNGYQKGKLTHDFGKNPYDTMDAFQVANAPLAKGLFEYFGRLVTYHNENVLRFSAIGNPFSWYSYTDVPNNPNIGKDIEIGYKDDGYIVAAYNLNNKIIVFKSSGSIYAVTGDPTQATVVLVGRNSDIVNKDAVCRLGGELMYMSYHGMKNLSTSTLDNNFRNDLVGKQVNNQWVSKISKPVLWNEERNHALYISLNQHNEVWVYQYLDNAFTRWEFPEGVDINAMAETNQDLLIGNGKFLCKFVDNGVDWDAKNLKTVPIVQVFKSREITDSDLLNAFKEHIKVTPLTDRNVTGTLYVYDEPRIQRGEAPHKVTDFALTKFYPNFHVRHQIRSEALQWEVHFDEPCVFDMFRADVIISQDGNPAQSNKPWTTMVGGLNG